MASSGFPHAVTLSVSVSKLPLAPEATTHGASTARCLWGPPDGNLKESLRELLALRPCGFIASQAEPFFKVKMLCRSQTLLDYNSAMAGLTGPGLASICILILCWNPFYHPASYRRNYPASRGDMGSRRGSLPCYAAAPGLWILQGFQLTAGHWPGCPAHPRMGRVRQRSDFKSRNDTKITNCVVDTKQARPVVLVSCLLLGENAPQKGNSGKSLFGICFQVTVHCYGEVRAET